jgi:hypothetical protein
MAFCGTSLRQLLQVIGPRCFKDCKFLADVVIDSPSQLSRIEIAAFQETPLRRILLPLVNSADFTGVPQECQLMIVSIAE